MRLKTGHYASLDRHARAVSWLGRIITQPLSKALSACPSNLDSFKSQPVAENALAPDETPRANSSVACIKL